MTRKKKSLPLLEDVVVGKQQSEEASFRHAIYLAMDVFENRKRFAEMSKNPLQIKNQHKG